MSKSSLLFKKNTNFTGKKLKNFQGVFRVFLRVIFKHSEIFKSALMHL